MTDNTPKPTPQEEWERGEYGRIVQRAEDALAMRKAMAKYITRWRPLTAHEVFGIKPGMRQRTINAIVNDALRDFLFQSKPRRLYEYAAMFQIWRGYLPDGVDGAPLTPADNDKMPSRGAKKHASDGQVVMPSPDDVKVLYCTKCNETKPFDEDHWPVSKRVRMANGEVKVYLRRDACSECHNRRMRDYRAKKKSRKQAQNNSRYTRT